MLKGYDENRVQHKPCGSIHINRGLNMYGTIYKWNDSQVVLILLFLIRVVDGIMCV